MTSGIVFVLHGPADAAYATDLAEALSPILVFPVALQIGAERPVQYGAGAVCVALWTQDAAARGLAGEVRRVMHGAVSGALVCRIGDAPLPEEFSGAVCIQVQQLAGAREVGALLGEAIARKADRNARPRRSATPLLGAAQATSPGREGTGRIAVRSAWGLAATMAIVGVAAPVVGSRAGAANVTPDNTAAPSEATVVTARSAASDAGEPGEVVEAALRAAQGGHSRERLVVTVQQPGSEQRAQEAPPPVAELEALATVASEAPQLHPSTSEEIGTTTAAERADRKIEAVAPISREKPAAAHPSRKPGAGA